MSAFLSNLSQFGQVVGVLLIAALLWPIVRVIRERYLVYWAWGWALMAFGLVALFLGFQVSTLSPLLGVFLRVVYCLCGYAFGFLLWAGSRRYATGRAIRPVELLWLLPPAVYGTVAPFVLTNMDHLFGGHAVLLAAVFLAALWQTRRIRPPGLSAVGLRLCQGALLGMCLLFAHYAVVYLGPLFLLPAEFRPSYLAVSSLYDLVLEAVLALGMVSIATERMRSELEEKNRRLRMAATELEQAARTDPLTGLLNRRGMTELLARSDGLPAGCVASLDLNDLKPLNDRYGHDAGDVALRLVGRALRNLFRVTDPIFRLGGDEFLVLVPGATQEDMTRRMESLDLALAGQRLPGVESLTNLTVSWGVARYQSAADLTAAVKAADEAMYQQKRRRKSSADR